MYYNWTTPCVETPEMNTSFTLDQQLRRDCHVLGKFDDSFVLLLNNALYPWFILVPVTSATEFHKVDAQQQLKLLTQINRLSTYIENHFEVSKLNTACIGNIVRQLHIHIIGRHTNDPCWPGVVWGSQQTQTYSTEEVKGIQASLLTFIGADFVIIDSKKNPE